MNIGMLLNMRGFGAYGPPTVLVRGSSGLVQPISGSLVGEISNRDAKILLLNDAGPPGSMLLAEF
jgi:hypothetical protein